MHSGCYYVNMISIGSRQGKYVIIYVYEQLNHMEAAHPSSDPEQPVVRVMNVDDCERLTFILITVNVWNI